MELQDHPHETQQLFVAHECVLKYLKDYSKTIFGAALRVMSDKEVIDLYYKKSDLGIGAWHLTSRGVSTGSKLEKEYDGVVVAVGMFNTPFIPDFKGIEE